MQASTHRLKRASGAADRPAGEAFDRGLRLMRAGDHAGAERSYRQCLDADPEHGEAHHHLGLLAARRGDADLAIAALERAIALLPDGAEAHANLGLVLRHAGRVDEAVANCRQATLLQPGSAKHHHALGAALVQAGAPEQASQAFAIAAGLDPDSNAAGFARAEALRLAGRAGHAMEVCRRTLEREPEHPEGLNTLGLLLDEAGDPSGAQACFRKAYARSPDAVHLLVNLAHVAIKLNDLDQASSAVERALRIAPTNPAALGNLGTIRKLQGRVDEAVAAFREAIAVDPGNARHYANIGALLVGIRQADAAVAACGIAVALAPGDAEAHFNLAVAQRQKGLLGPAIAAYRRAYELGLAAALVDVCHLRQQICDWPGLADEQALCRATTYRRGLRVAPFSILTATSSPEDHRLSARVYAAGYEASSPALAARAIRPVGTGARLRIGYLSSDFHEHATSSLIVGLIERHDRARFTCFGYSYGPDDHSPMRNRIASAFDRFVDVQQLGHEAVARRIAADEIDILIDLKGYTQDARTEILALRPAPIQVNYLGYPGTMGASFIDYLVADPFIVPPASQGLYDEAVATLPHCYQPNDTGRAVAASPGRRGVGLPDDAVVFCSFNNTYKITPAVFDVWMRVLRAVPGSVLWLLDAAEAVATNLRREAVARGVGPERLVFAPRVPSDQHIGRMALADLFLDTTPVNAHTTASEALWVGLPVLTCAGESFVSRVAGSLLHAMGVPDLVTTTLADYEAMAVALARNPGQLAAIRARLVANRATSPLFDIGRYTCNFERALTRMAEIRQAGRAPESFTVAEQDARPH